MRDWKKTKVSPEESGMIRNCLKESKESGNFKIHWKTLDKSQNNWKPLKVFSWLLRCYIDKKHNSNCWFYLIFIIMGWAMTEIKVHNAWQAFFTYAKYCKRTNFWMKIILQYWKNLLRVKRNLTSGRLLKICWYTKRFFCSALSDRICALLSIIHFHTNLDKNCKS